jgi:hypothetical protein
MPFPALEVAIRWKATGYKKGHPEGQPGRTHQCTMIESCADVGISSTRLFNRDALVSRASREVDNPFVVWRKLVVPQLFLGQSDYRYVVGKTYFQREFFGQARAECFVGNRS